MPQNKASYTFNSGPATFIRAGGARARKGETVDLSDSEVIDLTQRGFILEPVDGRRKLPDPPADETPASKTSNGDEGGDGAE